MPHEPDKTLHEDLGLTSLGAALPQSAGTGAHDASAPADEAALSSSQDFFVAPEPVWTARRIAAAVCILAALAGEIAWAVTRSDPSDEQRTALAALSESDKAALADKQRRYQKLSAEEQARLHGLAAEFAADSDQASLLATLDQYLQWKTHLAPQQSALLVGLPPQPRYEKVQGFVAEQQALAAREFSEADSRIVVAWLEKQVREHQDKLLENLPGIVRERFESMGSRERTWALMYYVLSGQRGPGPSRFDVVSPQALLELHGQLSPPAQARWDAAYKDTKNKDALKDLLSDWIRRSIERVVGIRSDGPGPNDKVDERELRKFFETEIAEADRQRLLALSPDEMQSQLRREYLRRKGLWKEPTGGRFGPPRPFGASDTRRPTSGFRKPPEPTQPNDGQPPSGGKPPAGKPPAERNPPKKPGSVS